METGGIYSKYKEFNRQLILLIFLGGQVYSQVLRCENPLLSPNYCQRVCGDAPTAPCVNGRCVCTSACAMGVPPVPGPLNPSLCPSPNLNPVLVVQLMGACNRFCSTACTTGGVVPGMLCGDPALAPRDVGVCACACQPPTCPPALNMTVTNVIGFRLPKLSLKNVFLLPMKKVYLILFLLAQLCLFTELSVVVFWWYFLNYEKEGKRWEDWYE